MLALSFLINFGCFFPVFLKLQLHGILDTVKHYRDFCLSASRKSVSSCCCIDVSVTAYSIITSFMWTQFPSLVNDIIALCNIGEINTTSRLSSVAVRDVNYSLFMRESLSIYMGLELKFKHQWPKWLCTSLPQHPALWSDSERKWSLLQILHCTQLQPNLFFTSLVIH